jgi:hypothetical protein
MWKWIVLLFLVLLISHCYRVEHFHEGGYGGYRGDGWGWGWWPFNWWPVIWYDYE